MDRTCAGTAVEVGSQGEDAAGIAVDVSAEPCKMTPTSLAPHPIAQVPVEVCTLASTEVTGGSRHPTVDVGWLALAGVSDAAAR